MRANKRSGQEARTFYTWDYKRVVHTADPRQERTTHVPKQDTLLLMPTFQNLPFVSTIQRYDETWGFVTFGSALV